MDADADAVSVFVEGTEGDAEGESEAEALPLLLLPFFILYSVVNRCFIFLVGVVHRNVVCFCDASV